MPKWDPKVNRKGSPTDWEALDAAEVRPTAEQIGDVETAHALRAMHPTSEQERTRRSRAGVANDQYRRDRKSLKDDIIAAAFEVADKHRQKSATTIERGIESPKAQHRSAVAFVSETLGIKPDTLLKRKKRSQEKG